MADDVSDNTAKSRYELNVDGHIAFVDYRLRSDKIVLVHTEVPSELGGGFTLPSHPRTPGPTAPDVLEEAIHPGEDGTRHRRLLRDGGQEGRGRRVD